MKNDNRQMNIGWAQINITPDRPVAVSGQLYSRVSSYVHDPVTATALVLENGAAQAVLVSLDTVGLFLRVIEQIKKELDKKGKAN